jgi:hypothetical protein
MWTETFLFHTGDDKFTYTAPKNDNHVTVLWTQITNLQIANSMLKVGNASGLWRHVYIALPSIRIYHETFVRTIWRQK